MKALHKVRDSDFVLGNEIKRRATDMWSGGGAWGQGLGGEAVLPAATGGAALSHEGTRTEASGLEQGRQVCVREIRVPFAVI